MEQDILETMTFRVCDQELRVRVPAEERPYYERVAEAANRAWGEVSSGRVIEPQRALAMTVFQMAAELVEARESLEELAPGRERLGRLVERIQSITDTQGE